MPPAPSKPSRSLGKFGRDFVMARLGRIGPDVVLHDASFTATALKLRTTIDGEECRLVLESPRHATERFLYENEKIGLWVQGWGSTFETDERKQDIAARAFLAFSGVDVERSCARLEADALHFVGHPRDDVPSRHEVVLKRFDRTEFWWKFVYPAHAYLDGSIDLGGRYVRIQHGTLECEVNNPIMPLDRLRFFRNPGSSPAPASFRCLSSDITEHDVLAGRTFEALREKIEVVSDELRPDCLHVATTCLPDMLGDNPMLLLQDVSRRTGCQTFWTAKTRDASLNIESRLRSSLAAVDRVPAERREGVVVGGVWREAERNEARSLLEALGLSVEGFLYPNLDLAGIASLGRARGFVWVDPVPWRKVSDGPLLDRLPVVRYYPPYGERGTVSWMKRVAAQLGLDSVGARVGAMQERFRSELKALRAEARDYTVAFVGDTADVDLLLNGQDILGYSAGWLLAELGFELRCLTYAPADAPRRERARAPLGNGGVEFRSFSSREQLDTLLADVSLVFSHFNHDSRLARHGLAGFCEEDFGLGLAGSVATARRLLRRARVRPRVDLMRTAGKP